MSTTNLGGADLVALAREHPNGPVATAFAERIMALEAAVLSPRATSSYPARRVCARRSSATATGSCTARRSAG